MQFLEVLAALAGMLIFVLQMAFLARALLPLFMQEDHPIATFLIALTEPVIIPFRALFDKMGWFQNTPIDAPFAAAILALGLLSYLLVFV